MPVKSSVKRAGNSHSKVKSQVLKAIGAETDIMVWNNPTGTFISPTGGIVKVGNKGAGDIIGLMRKSLHIVRVIGENTFQPHERQSDETVGIMFAIEVKTGKGVQRKEQKTWQDAFEGFGGKYCVCHNANEAKAFIQELRDI